TEPEDVAHESVLLDADDAGNGSRSQSDGGPRPGPPCPPRSSRPGTPGALLDSYGGPRPGPPCPPRSSRPGTPGALLDSYGGPRPGPPCPPRSSRPGTPGALLDDPARCRRRYGTRRTSLPKKS